MDTFKNIILTSRPASGKSEFIDFLKRLPIEERKERFHIGKFEELDDHQLLWAVGESDDIWEGLGRKRKYTRNIGCGYVPFDSEQFYDGYLNLKLNGILLEKYCPDREFYKDKTLFIEFARGGVHGYRKALDIFDREIYKECVILFINNSFEECIRRNDARYEASKKHSILAHKVPDEEMHGYYYTHDWSELTGGRTYGLLEVKGERVPFYTIVNEPEVTGHKLMENRFLPAFEKLWELMEGYNGQSL